MRIHWFDFAKSTRYRDGTRAERCLIEVQISVGLAVRGLRRALRLTQQNLAERIGSTQSTIARMERASGSVTMHLYVRALIALGASDEQRAAAFNPGQCWAVQKLRGRAELPYYLSPIDERGKGVRKAKTRRRSHRDVNTVGPTGKAR